jgi:hypothetical protein
MIDILGLFFLEHFDANIYWWVLFLIVFLAEVYAKGRKWEKIEEYLDNAKKEYEHKQERRKKFERKIYLGDD